jgi:hypothetical protein
VRGLPGPRRPHGCGIDAGLDEHAGADDASSHHLVDDEPADHEPDDRAHHDPDREHQSGDARLPDRHAALLRR